MKSRKENFKTRFLAGVVALAMIFTMFGVMPEKTMAASGAILVEGMIYTLEGCEWMAAEVHDDYTTLVMTKGNTADGKMCGAWPGYIKNSNTSSNVDIEYENISSYYPGTIALYRKICRYEYSNAPGNGLYLIPKTLIDGETGFYYEALKTAATQYFSFGSQFNLAWSGTAYGKLSAYYISNSGTISNITSQYSACVIAPAFNIDTSKICLNGNAIVTTYTIAYNANGGSGSMNTSTFSCGSFPTLPSNTFTNPGYTFSGWATSPSGSVAYMDGITVGDDFAFPGDVITLYAVWQPDSVTITFNDYNGTQIAQNSVAYNSDLAAPADPTRTGYTFTGWSENGSDVITLPAKVTENKTYTAVYTANTYTIKYDANGGSGSMADTAATYDQDVTLRNNTFTKANNTFKGWATSASGSVAYNNGSTVRNLSAASGSAVTLYAVWETQQSSGGNSGGSNSGSSSGSGGSSGGGGGFYVPVQPSKPEEKPEEKPAEPTEPTTDTASETIDGCTVNTTISKDAAGNITSATAEISVNASGQTSANNMSITLSSAVIAKLKELAGSADMDIAIDVCVPVASTKSLADTAEQKSTVVTTINTTLVNLCKGSRPVRIVSGKNVLAPATLTAKADGSIVLSKLTPKYNYKVLSSKDYSSARTAIYKTAKLTKTSATIKKGKTTTIKLSTKFDKKNLKKITYSTSNKKIATVSKSGKVTGKKKGTATIKAKLYMQDGKTKTLTFKVKVK